ncbi:MAG: hypothetical protein OEM27_08535 [Nitrospinota bacterium]|nr:hypothetical protein [Nitrospinota bacterium]
MKSFIEFNKKIFGMKFPWNLWLGLLILVNLGGGLFFIRTMEGQLALACLLFGFLIMWGIYVKKGFVRLLGLGHLIAWTPQIVWYIQVIGSTAGWFQYWLISAIVVNGLSLVIDFVDVVRYSLGDRQPTG